VELRDRRYDAVVHLVTAADGAEAFYSTANNTARSETPAQARALDEKLRDAWVGHPHLRVIDNSTDFPGKVRRVLEAVCRVTGVPEPVEVERKYLVRNAPAVLPVRAEEVEIEQTYLRTADGSEARVRRRGQRGSYSYTHTAKKALRTGARVEVERMISGREYIGLLAESDPTRKTVRKRRTCFLHDGQYFELDRFLEPKAGLVLLEVELDDEKTEVRIPPFIEIEREVTSEAAYSNHFIAAGVP
jgi:CYTH domain-containing protein